MSERILDLDKLPYVAGPVKTYDQFLLWKVLSMQLGESFQLPIFSAFHVLRLSEGYVLENRATGQIWAFSAKSYKKILAAVETQAERQHSRYEAALKKYYQANRLHQQGMDNKQIAKLIEATPNRVKTYVEWGSLELAS